MLMDWLNMVLNIKMKFWVCWFLELRLHASHPLLNTLISFWIIKLVLTKNTTLNAKKILIFSIFLKKKEKLLLSL